MVKKRHTPTPRARRHPADHARPAGFPQWEHNAFSFEGEIERLGGISRGMSNAPRWARLVARGVALAILVPVAIGLAQYVARLVF